MDAIILSIDGAGASNGTITIGYAPCTEDGVVEEEELPEEFMVDNCEELIGMDNLYFKVYVKHA